MPKLVSLAEARERGLNRYFTGNPCPQNHICERDTKHKECVRCRKLAKRRRAAEKRRENPLKRYRTGKPCRRAGHVCERLTGDAQCIECSREKKPGRVKRARARTRKRFGVASGRHFSRLDIVKIFDLQKGRCAYYARCGNAITLATCHSDHVIPLADKRWLDSDFFRIKGPPNGAHNMQLCCVGCSRKKGARDPLAFAIALTAA